MLSGQIDGWTRGSNFTMQAFVTTTSALSSGLTSAPIDAAGNFSITLPGAAELAPYITLQHVDVSSINQNCKAMNFQLDPQEFSSTTLRLQAVSGNTRLTVSQATTPTATTAVTYIFVDRPVSETGTLTCTFGSTSLNETADIHLSPGWNRQIVTITAGQLNASTGAAPADVKWLAK